MSKIVFLGTGGGGKVTFTQVRATGGIYVDLDRVRFIIDPGPGSLIHLRRLKLRDPEGILLSHSHPDHYTDVDVLLDGISEKYENSFLIAEHHCLEGESICVSKYMQRKVKRCIAMKAGDEAEIAEGIKVIATESRHYVPCIGFRIEGDITIGYVGDGPYFEGQERSFEECGLVIFNVLVPKGHKPMERKHMSIDGVIEFVQKLEKKPKLIILQHFSFWMLRSNVHLQAKYVEEATGVRCIAARDFMQVDLSDIERSQHKLEEYA